MTLLFAPGPSDTDVLRAYIDTDILRTRRSLCVCLVNCINNTWLFLLTIVHSLDFQLIAEHASIVVCIVWTSIYTPRLLLFIKKYVPYTRGQFWVLPLTASVCVSVG